LQRQNGVCGTPSEVKDVEHTLVIPQKYTRAHLEMLLAFHYDLYPREPAEDGVEGAGDYVVDIISPSYEGKGKRRAKS
jgi:hypothetical protein